MKYKIYLDSNRLYNQIPLEEPFNLQIPELREFLDEHDLGDVDICLPEIVIRERIQHKLESITEKIDAINSHANSLKGVGHNIRKIKPHTDYKKILQDKVKDFLKKNKVIRIGMPSITKDDLIERAINKMKPFNDNTAGFKDTLIFLSIIEDALGATSADRYIFCSNDHKEFNQDVVDEFKATTGKSLYILSDVTKIKETLDELIPLNLHLEERNNKLKNLIMNNIGNLVALVNKDINKKPTNGLNFFAVNEPVTSIFSQYTINSRFGKKEEDVVGYNYDDIVFNSFNESSETNFTVSASLTVKVIRKDNIIRESSELDVFRLDTVIDAQTDAIFPPGYNSRFFSDKKTFSINIDCDIKNNTILPHIGLVWF